MFITVPMEHGKLKLSETALVHCTDARVLLGGLCCETKLEFGIVRCGKGFPMCSLIPFIHVNHTLHHLSHRLIFFRMEVAEKPLPYLSAWLPNHSIILRRFGRLVSSKSCLRTCGWFESHQLYYWHWHARQLCSSSTPWKICCAHALSGRPLSA